MFFSSGLTRFSDAVSSFSSALFKTEVQMKPSSPNLKKLGFHSKLGHHFSSVPDPNIIPDLSVTRNQAGCFLPDDVSDTTPWSPYSCICTRSASLVVLVSDVSSQDGESVVGRWDSSHSTS